MTDLAPVNQLPTEPGLDPVETRAVELAYAGASRRVIAEELGVGLSTLQRRIRTRPDFAAALESAAEEHSTIVLERIRDVPNTATDSARGRMTIEALRTYLELRWPARYGRHVTMDVRHLDMTQAITAARQRATQVFDSTAHLSPVATDCVSVAGAEADDE